MKKGILLYTLLIALVALSITSCNKKTEGNEPIVFGNSYSSALVKSFNLKSDTKVLANLDSIHFCIDQDKKVIYNPDSLPMGTNITKLLCSVSFGSESVSSATLVVGGGKVMQQDTTINYSESMTDSIDFSGHVTLNVTSLDGTSTMSYRILVNVHKENPDTIVFPMAARRNLPASGDDNYAVGMTSFNDTFYSMVNNSNGRYVATSTTPDGKWDIQHITLPFEPVEETLTATSTAMYILDNAGNLYTSTDALTWNPTGTMWTTIIGAYDDRVLGLAMIDGTLCNDEYPRRSGFAPTAIPAGFPVSGHSQLIIESRQWTVGKTAIMFGGRDATGKLKNTSWGYDGNTWGEFKGSATNDVPALEGATLFSYITHDMNVNSQHATPRATWVVMGGKLQDGKMNRHTYISRDMGITWVMGSTSIEIPSYIPSFAGAKAFVCTTTYSSKAPSRRVSRPITEWEVPFVYIVGGTGENGQLHNNVWKGVISRLTHKPIY